MTRINLLPWRQLRREQQQREFVITLAGVAVLAVGCVIAVHLAIGRMMDVQRARNQYLNQQIDRVKHAEKAIKAMRQAEQSLLDRLQAIKRLQQSRPDMVKVFNSLVRLTPPALFVTSLTANDNRLEVKGDARDNKVVSDFMRELGRSPLFGEPVLKIIQRHSLAQNVPASSFDLTVNRIQPSKKASE